MKRILAFVVVVSVLLSVCSISAAAAPLYSVEADTQPFSYNTKASVLDNSIALAEVTQSELASLFQQYFYYGGDEVGWFLYSINNKLGNFTTSNSLYHYIDLIYSQLSNTQNNSGISGMLYDMLNYSLISNSSYLNQSGGTTTAFSAVGMAELIRSGFLGLSVKLDDIETIAGGIDYTSLLNSILTGVSNVNTALGTTNTRLDTINTSVGQVNTSVGNVNTSVGQVNTSVGEVETAVSNLEDALSEYMTLPAGNFILSTSGFSTETSSVFNVTDIMRRGFIGISAHLRSLSGSGFLNANGQQSVTAENQTLSYILRYGFLGLRSLISGSESDNTYSLTLLDNNNESSSVNATGLGPMFRVALGNVGENLAKLTFMFAADDDIQLKKDSQPVLDNVTDTVFGSGSGKVKLDVSNVSDLTGMSDDVLGYFETGGQMGDINTVVNDDSTWLWFTAQTAADLDTTGSSLTLADVELDPEVDSHTEWYASFYRDVLGRDYVGG